MATIVQWVDSAYGWPTPLQIAAGILIAIVALIGLVVIGYTLVLLVLYGCIWHEVRFLGKVVGFLTVISLPLVIAAVLPLGLPDNVRPWSSDRSPLCFGGFTGG